MAINKMPSPTQIGASYADFATLAADPPAPDAGGYQLYVKSVGGNLHLFVQTSGGALDVTAALAGALVAANNLSDVANSATARTNLGAQTYDAQLFSNIPQNSKSANYTTVAGDAQKHILHPASDNNARTFTIDSNANVPYAVGTAITFVNMINTVTIAIATDTMYLAGTGATGNRTLAAYGVATAIKIASTTWIIAGSGLT